MSAAAAAVAYHKNAQRYSGNSLDASIKNARQSGIRRGSITEVILEERSPAQRAVAKVMRSFAYELTLCFVVLFNVLLMIIDVDANAGPSCRDKNSCTPRWVEVLDYILLGVYTLDVVLAIYWQQCTYFKVKMNYIDLVIVIFGYFEIIVALVSDGGGSLSMIRMLRMCRIMRVARLLKPLPELYKLVMGFVGTIRAIFWGFIMICLLLLGWSIVFLQAYATIDTDAVFQDDELCDEFTTSTLRFSLLLWQNLIAGDSWGRCAIPAIMEHPWLYILFSAAFITVNLGFTNLILAVIVDNSNNMHEDEKIKQVLEQKAQTARDIEGFQTIFQEMDSDKSGIVTYDELLNGYDQLEGFRSLLLRFGLDQNDLELIFDALDADSSGGLTYDEFITAMFRTQRHESSIQLMMIQMSIKKLSARLEQLDDGLRVGLGVSSPKVSRTLTPRSPRSPRGSKKPRHSNSDLSKASKVTVESIDLEALKRCTLESIECPFAAATHALEQQTLAFSREAERVRVALQQFSVQRTTTGLSEHLSDVPRAELNACAGANDRGDNGRQNGVGCDSTSYDPGAVPDSSVKQRTRLSKLVPKPGLFSSL